VLQRLNVGVSGDRLCFVGGFCGTLSGRLVRGVRYSLISATSIFALAAASAAHGYVHDPAPSETNLYDLVHDSDSNVAAPDPRATAVMALQRTEIDRQGASFTGPIDVSTAAGTAFPLVPLGAAPGTPPDEDFATQYTGAWHWNAWQKALAIGVARIAPLIGTIGNGFSPNDKPASTVFIAEGNHTGFSDGGVLGSMRRLTAVNGFGPSSTSTATMTVTGPANIPQRAGSGFSAPAPTGAEPRPAASQPAPVATEPPTPSYHYAPQPSPGGKSNMVAASFSNAITASGSAALVYKPVVPSNDQPGTGSGGSNSLPTNEEAAIYARLIVVTLPVDGQANTIHADGTRAFLSASVSANPEAAATSYVMSVLDAVRAGASVQTIEGFQIGQVNGARTPGGAATRVVDPLQGKVMAGVGPLDNSLALP